MIPTRQVYWNVEGHYWLYVFFAFALLSFGYGVYRRVKLWKTGQPEERWSEAWQGIKNVIVNSLGQKRVLQESYAGTMHVGIFLGFIFLTFATVMIIFQADLGWKIFQGNLYLFVKLTANLFGLAALIGIIMAAFRRYVYKSKTLDNNADDAITLGLIFAIILTGFIIEGARMAVQTDPWASWGFVGAWLSIPLKAIFNPGQLLVLHRWLWWFHLVLAMAFIGYLPYSKMLHIFLAPINHFLRKQGPIGVPTLIDFMDESQETFGVSSLNELSWKNLFNSDVCLRCGRCQNNCPAYLSGKHLNPKQAIQEIKGLMEEEGRTSAPTSRRELVGEAIPVEDLWACTTCRSCEQQCPVFIEHVDKTLDMRRHLVLNESRFPAEAQLAFRNMESKGNPWGIAWNTRADFLKGLGVPTLEENPEAEILYWPGCFGAFDYRNQKVAAAVVTLLRSAKVNFAILGNEEKCCGESARRLGNEFLFQTLASENIDVLKEYGVKKVLTQCPHCFNIMKNEYLHLEAEFETVHHTTYFKELIAQGRLKLGKTTGETVTFHDSCYLGRYNNIYQEPRELLNLVGLNVTEMKNHGAKGFCCGGGGGHIWLEEHEGQRINEMRTDEAIAIGAELVGTACPFCLTMINDGVKAREASDKMKVLDVAEILVQAL